MYKNDYRGTVSVSVRIRDIGYADTDRESVLSQLRDFEAILRREICPSSSQTLASREQLARLYNLLRVCKEWKGTPDQLHHALGADAPSCLQMLVALEVWQQAGLVRWCDRGDQIEIHTLPADGKVDMTATPLWQYLKKGDVENGG